MASDLFRFAGQDSYHVFQLTITSTMDELNVIAVRTLCIEGDNLIKGDSNHWNESTPTMRMKFSSLTR